MMLCQSCECIPMNLTCHCSSKLIARPFLSYRPVHQEPRIGDLCYTCLPTFAPVQHRQTSLALLLRGGGLRRLFLLGLSIALAFLLVPLEPSINNVVDVTRHPALSYRDVREFFFNAAFATDVGSVTGRS